MRTHKRWLTVGAVLLALLLVSAIPVAADPGIIYVDPSGIGLTPCGSAPGVWACKTITLALTMAQPGDTIQVASGTALVPYEYAEDLVINKANLTIVSSGGAAKTVIAGAVDAQADADGLTFGQPGGGFTLRSTGAGALFRVTNGPANVTLDSNIFDMTVGGPPGSGVFVDGGPATDGLSVINNRFDQALLAYVGVNIWKPVTNLLVDGNDFNGTAGVDNWLSAVTFKNSTVDGAVISNNTIDSASVAMAMGPDGTSMTDITISGNTFSDVVREEGGVIIVEEVEGTTQRVSNIAITGNTFQPSTYDSFAFVISNRDAGVEDTDLDYDTISFTCNNVLDPYEVVNTHPIVANLANDALPAGIPDLNAESNWWGTRSGPMHASNTYTEPGNVAAFVDVSDDVDFLPWLDAPCPAGSDFAPVALDGVWDYSSIQGAIDDAAASTVQTQPGTFTESVLVNKSVDILGAGSGITKLMPDDSYGFEVVSDTVKIDGFHIYGNATAGVLGDKVGGLTVSNNEVDDWTTGMLFQDTKGNLLISGNLVHGNTSGIVVYGDATTIAVHNNSIVGNTTQVDNAGTGVLNAECNWWGDKDGPVLAEVKGLVDFDPWTTLGLSAVDGRAEANGSDAEVITASLVCGGSAVPAGHPLDFTKVDFTTDLGWFTLTLQDVEADVPFVDGKAAVKLYSQWVGRAEVGVSVADAADWVEEANLVAFYPEKPSILYPPHRTTIRKREPIFSWTESPAAEGVRVFYQLRLVKVRPLPKELVFKAWTRKTSYQSPYLDGRIYFLRVRACARFFDPNLRVCSRWTRSRFKIR